MKLLRALALAAGLALTGFVTLYAVSTAVVLAILTGGPDCWFATHPRFEQDVWMSADTDQQCGVRYDMVDDILTNHVRPGMAKADIVALLGPPEDLEYGYLLGCWMDCDWVIVQYEKGDRVVEAYRYQD